MMHKLYIFLKKAILILIVAIGIVHICFSILDRFRFNNTDYMKDHIDDDRYYKTTWSSDCPPLRLECNYLYGLHKSEVKGELICDDETIPVLLVYARQGTHQGIYEIRRIESTLPVATGSGDCLLLVKTQYQQIDEKESFVFTILEDNIFDGKYVEIILERVTLEEAAEEAANIY